MPQTPQIPSSSRAIGVNRVGNKLLTAIVSNDGARLNVDNLICTENGVNQDGKNHESQNNFPDGRLFFGVSPDIVIIKKINLKAIPTANLTDLTDLVRFEMSQSLLEPPESFYFDALPVGLGGEEKEEKEEKETDEKRKHQSYLSIAYHRTQVDALMDEYKNKITSPSGFKLDAVALVDGYLAFCQRQSSELEAILDLRHNRVAIAFVFRDHLYGVANLQFQREEEPEADDRHWSMMATEIKMMLDFQLSRFFEEGVTIPLSRVIVSGQLARHSTLRKALDDLLSTPVNLPSFHDGYFLPLANKLDDLHPERFLISLGLAVV